MSEWIYWNTLKIEIVHLKSKKMEHLRTVVFTKQSFGPLFGFYDLEHIWNCSKYTEAEKIAEINYYINHIVDKERPEVIIIEAPDSIMRYNDYALNGFEIRIKLLIY